MKIYLIWILLTESLTFAQSYSSSLCFEQRYGISTICNGKSYDLFCNPDDVIMINTIRYAKSDFRDEKCYHCLNNKTMSTWEIDPTPFKNRVYQLCSQQNNCSFDEEVETPRTDEGMNRYSWKAIISYDCVSSGLIRDICSPLDAVLEKATDSVYLSLHEYRRNLQHCSCIIVGDIRATNITIIDYRPYYQDFKCQNSSVFVNGKPLLQCLNTSDKTDSSLYNKPVNVTDSRTNITVSKHDMLPDMLWISVTGLDSTIHCNIEDKVTIPSTSSLTPVSPMGTTPNHFTTDISNVTQSNTKGTTDKTTQRSSLEHDINSEDFPSSMIAGTSLGVIAIVSVILTACLLYRRRPRRMSEPRSKEVVYSNETHHEAEHPEESRIDGDTNRAREDGDRLYVNMSNYSPHESNNVYLNMGHQDLHEADAKHTEETIRDVKYQNENRVHGVEEPYYKNVIRGDEIESNYCKLNKTDENVRIYNKLTGNNTC